MSAQWAQANLGWCSEFGSVSKRTRGLTLTFPLEFSPVCCHPAFAPFQHDSNALSFIAARVSYANWRAFEWWRTCGRILRVLLLWVNDIDPCRVQLKKSSSNRLFMVTLIHFILWRSCIRTLLPHSVMSLCRQAGHVTNAWFQHLLLHVIRSQTCDKRNTLAYLSYFILSYYVCIKFSSPFKNEKKMSTNWSK